MLVVHPLDGIFAGHESQSGIHHRLLEGDVRTGTAVEIIGKLNRRCVATRAQCVKQLRDRLGHSPMIAHKFFLAMKTGSPAPGSLLIVGRCERRALLRACVSKKADARYRTKPWGIFTPADCPG